MQCEKHKKISGFAPSQIQTAVTTADQKRRGANCQGSSAFVLVCVYAANHRNVYCALTAAAASSISAATAAGCET